MYCVIFRNNKRMNRVAVENMKYLKDFFHISQL